MKKRQIWVAGAMLCAAILGGCKKDNNSAPSAKDHLPSNVSFTINGDGFSNKQVIINGAAAVLENSASYFPKWNYTQATVGDQTTEGSGNKNSMSLFFDGKSTGTQNFGAEFKNDHGIQIQVNMVLTLQKGSSTADYKTTESNTASSASGTVSIKTYSDVNGLVTGEFSGTLTNIATGKAVTIKDGKFSVERIIDTSL